MYLAEIQGKFTPAEERKEDILTSNVFSFFKYAKREIFLYQLLQFLKLDVTKNDVGKAEFYFWPTYEDGTEPDVVVIVGKYYLLFEAKLHSRFGKGSDFSQHQIMREIKGGEIESHNCNKQFRFVVVTAHYTKRQFFAENPDIPEFSFLWINWHQIALLLLYILGTESVENETRCFAEDLYSLFLNKNLRKFAGVEVLAGLQNLLPSPPMLFFDSRTAEHRGDFLGFVNSLGTSQLINRVPNYIFFHSRLTYTFGKQNQMLNYLPDTIFFKR